MNSLSVNCNGLSAKISYGNLRRCVFYCHAAINNNISLPVYLSFMANQNTQLAAS
jgi:hypothetical protein